MAMPRIDETVEAIAIAETWDARIALIRKVPEEYGTAQRQAVYAAIAKRVYVPHLTPDFAYVHWRPDYDLGPIQQAYQQAHALTSGFATVDVSSLEAAILATPETLLIFRLLLGLTTQEFAAATKIVAVRHELKVVSNSTVKKMESGGRTKADTARCCATVIDLAMRGLLFTAPTQDVRSKIDKPDTVEGWSTVQRLAAEGVPLPIFLHQRYYGGAFRQLLDATSTKRGDVIEDAVEDLFTARGVSFLRTGAHNQEEIATRFGITVRPAPDFVVFDEIGSLRALLECKAANDGGTARDKAARFAALHAEATRLGGVPLFAVLAGLGWTRTQDALGPVIRDTDGRTFTIPTLAEMMKVQPFLTLIRPRN